MNKQKKHDWHKFFSLFLLLPLLFGLVVAFLQIKSGDLLGYLGADILPNRSAHSEYAKDLPDGSLTREFLPAMIDIIFYLTGAAITVVITYAGYLHVTNFGDQEQNSKANKLLYWGALGIAVMALSYAIVWGITNLAFNRI